LYRTKLRLSNFLINSSYRIKDNFLCFDKLRNRKEQDVYVKPELLK